MSSEIELISDGDGFAVVGPMSDVDRFLLDEGLGDVPSRELDLGGLTGIGAAALKVGSDAAANSGRWIKLTKESAEAVQKYGLMASKTPGVKHAMIGKPGDVQQWLQVVQTPTALLSGPFALSALSTMMQQRAMQQQIDEIVEYLGEISEKVDDILRAQKDVVLAQMIGVDLVIDDALTVRDEVGQVSEVTWSKVQGASMTIAATQAFAIKRLEAIAEKLATKADVGDIAAATREAEPQIREWLAVIARTFQLQDALSVLELDRVLASSPDELDNHRLGLRAARQKRLAVIGRMTGRLLSQMHDTVGVANSAVLRNPFDAPAAVRSSNRVAVGLVEFESRLGLESAHATVEAKKWRRAAGEAVEKARASGLQGAAAAKRFSGETFDRASRPFRASDIDGDGVSDASEATAAVLRAGESFKERAAGVLGTAGTGLSRRRKDGLPSETPAAQSDALEEE